MAYICRDCGNKSTKKFTGGKCPACDSFNVKNTNTSKEAIKEREPKTLIELAMMAILWGGLAVGVWDRYIREEPVKVTEDVVKEDVVKENVVKEVQSAVIKESEEY